MKALLVLPAIALLAACSAEQGSTITTGFTEDNLATSDACFAETPSEHLEAGQTLLETGPAGVTRASWSLDGETGDIILSIAGMDAARKTAMDAANAAFYAAAGQQHDHTTDAVIYHRSMDGTFCTVVKDAATGRALVAALTNLPAADQASE